MKKRNRLYLKSLRIQNFATFTQEEIVFTPSFNAIVGETGSGKSLLLDALELVFGARADKKSIRKGAEFASVEATFETHDEQIKKYFKNIGHPFEENEIVVKRVIFQQESSKSFLNFQACSLATLSQFAKRYIDLVGQFENQKLLSDDYQLVLLDHYSKNHTSLKDYQELYNKYRSAIAQRESLEQEAADKVQREDFLRFQLNELDELSPTIEEEQKLVERKEVMSNWQKEKVSIQQLLDILSENDTSNVLNLLQQASKVSSSLHDNNLKHEDLETAKSLVEDYCFELSKNLEYEFDEEDFENIIDRLDQYQKLKRKYGGDTEKMLEAYTSFKSELDKLTNIDSQLQEVCLQEQKLYTQCQQLAQKLHQKRLIMAEELSQKLTASVQSLKMVGATLKFEVQEKKDLDHFGQSRVCLMAETNPGEGLFKVKEIASGGELSRILLALRQILSTHDSISVFLFDEIDSGVGGETALAVGSALQSVSLEGQVIAITHLPQIAKFSDQIVEVTKNIHTNDKRTISQTHLHCGSELKGFIKEMTSF